MARIITICSGKGGVGKTTIAVNLAIALHNLGKDVILLDGNLTTPNLGIHLGVYEVPYTIHDVLRGKATLNQAMYLHPLGFKVIPASLDIAKLSRNMRKELIHILDKVVHSSDFVIIDAAPGLGKEAQMAMDAGNEAVIVTNPEMPAVVDALKTIQIVKSKNSEVLGVVLNRITGTDELSLRNVAHFLEIPVIASISEERRMKEAIRRREPLLSLYPRIKTSREFMNLARKLCDLPEQEEPSILTQLAKWLGI